MTKSPFVAVLFPPKSKTRTNSFPPPVDLYIAAPAAVKVTDGKVKSPKSVNDVAVVPSTPVFVKVFPPVV